MSFFDNLAKALGSIFGRRKKDKEWAERYDGPPAKPSHPIPLDPNDPWKT